MNKRIRKMLSWALVLCLLISAVPASVVATEVEQTESIVAPAEQTMSTAAPAGQTITAGTITTEQLPLGEITIVREETSLRGQYEKHFLMSDGSYEAVVYSEPVHKLVDGVWVELDKEDLADVSINSDTSTDSTQQNIIDNYVLEGSGVQNSNLNRLYIGNKSGSIARAFIQFAVMPTIPQGAAITAATMTLTIYEGTSTANNASAYMVTGGEWTSGTISWENMPAAETLLQENISHNDLTKYQFSCLSAVQHWYDGDITGQNENYGVMIRYYDETIADYNSVFSADYTVATSRPSLRISYNPQVLYFGEGFSCTLTSPNVTGEIVWESSNTAVATVTSTGQTTGVKAGSATITASVDGTVVKAYTIYVIKQSGIYYINNCGNLYLGTNGAVANGTDTFLQTKATSGRAQLNQLWRIDHLSECLYSIRPFYKMDMGLTCENGVPGPVEITTIGTDSTSIPPVNKWTIEYKNDGYVFECVGTSALTMCRPQSYLSGVVETHAYYSTMAEYKWDMECVTSNLPNFNQVLLFDTETGSSAENVIRYVEVGDTVTLADMGIGASFVCAYNMDQSITWSTINTSVVSVNSATGAVTGLTSGETATITARHIHNGVAYEKYYKVCVICPDPLDPSKIEYMRQTRITGTNLTGGNTDHSIIVIKSLCSADPFFTAIDHVNGDVSRTYVINSELKNQLNALEAGYQDGFNAIPLFDQSTDNEKAAHAAKGETDQLVNAGKFASGSDEYYGVWAYNYVSLLNLADMWGSIIDTATKAYNIYLSITAFYYSWLATSNTNVVYISETQYDDIAAYIDDFDNAAYDINFSGISFVSAEERNLALAEQGYKTPLPYKEGTPVLVGKVSNCSSDVYVRVYTEGTTTQNGRWFMRYSDIQGLTAEEIRGKFALGDRAPTHYSFVTVPEGKTVFVGVVNESTIEGTIQFEILERAEIGWYGEIIELS